MAPSSGLAPPSDPFVGGLASSPLGSRLFGSGSGETIAPSTPVSTTIAALGVRPSDPRAVVVTLEKRLVDLSKAKPNRGGTIPVAPEELQNLIALATQAKNHVMKPGSDKTVDTHIEVKSLSTKLDQFVEAQLAANEALAQKIESLESAQTTAHQSYASVAASGATAPPPDRARKSATNPYAPKRDPTREITLRAPANSDARPFSGLSPAEMVQKVSAAINDVPTLRSQNIAVASVLRMPTRDVRVIVASKDQANAIVHPDVVHIWVNKLNVNLKYVAPVWRVVAHNVDRSFDLTDKGMIEEWKRSNGDLVTHVTDLAWLRIDAGEATRASLRISFPSPDLANRARRQGIAFLGTICNVQKARLPPFRCHRCQRHDHSAATCQNAARCAKCGDAHPTDEHPSRCTKHWGEEDCEAHRDQCAYVPTKCAGCGSADHVVFSRDCPETKKAEKRTKEAHLASGVDYDLNVAAPHFVPDL